MTRCESCPVTPGPCVVERTGHARFCEWAAEGGARRAEVLRLSLGLPESAPTAPVPLDHSLAILAAMKACPERSERTDCGCGGLATCHLGKGRGGLVGFQDCAACLGVGA